MPNDCPKMLFLLFLNFIIYTSFLTKLFFTTSLSSVKSTETGTNLSISNLCTLLFKVFKPLDKHFNLSLSNLSTSDFKLAKSVF